MESPQIFRYLEYREFLGDWIRWKKAAEPGFSLRAFAKSESLRLSSSSFLSAVLKGKKNLSAGLRLRFARALRLQAGELDYFEALVQFNQAKHADDRNHYFIRLSKYHGSRVRRLEPAQSEFFSRWYYRVVWNWLALHHNQTNPALIAKSMSPPLAPAEVEEAIRVLLDLGLLRRLANGYAVTDRHLSTEQGCPAPVASRHHRDLIQLAMTQLDHAPAESRQFNALTFSLSGQGFDRLRERLDSFRAEVRELVDTDLGGDRVFALSMQLFPCSRAAAAASPGQESPWPARAPGIRASGGQGGASVDFGDPGSP